jgi:hypothetical protein
MDRTKAFARPPSFVNLVETGPTAVFVAAEVR